MTSNKTYKPTIIGLILIIPAGLGLYLMSFRSGDPQPETADSHMSDLETDRTTVHAQNEKWEPEFSQRDHVSEREHLTVREREEKEDDSFTQHAADWNNRLRHLTSSDPALLAGVEEFLLEWVETNPEAAMRYALRPLTDAGVDAHFFHSADKMLIAWAERDLRAARRFIEEMGTDPDMVRLLGPALMNVYFTKDPYGAMRWVKDGFSSERDPLRLVVAKELVTALNEVGNRQMAATFLLQPDVVYGAYIHEAVVELARLETENGASLGVALVQRIPHGSTVRGLAWRETLRTWASNDPEAAGVWLTEIMTRYDEAEENKEGTVFGEREMPISTREFTTADIDFALAGYAIAIATMDPDLARANSGMIVDPALRTKALAEIRSISSFRASEEERL